MSEQEQRTRAMPAVHDSGTVELGEATAVSPMSPWQALVLVTAIVCLTVLIALWTT